MEALIFLMLFFGAACLLMIGISVIYWVVSPDTREDIMRDWFGR